MRPPPAGHIQEPDSRVTAKFPERRGLPSPHAPALPLAPTAPSTPRHPEHDLFLRMVGNAEPLLGNRTTAGKGDVQSTARSHFENKAEFSIFFSPGPQQEVLNEQGRGTDKMLVGRFLGNKTLGPIKGGRLGLWDWWPQGACRGHPDLPRSGRRLDRRKEPRTARASGCGHGGPPPLPREAPARERWRLEPPWPRTHNCFQILFLQGA